MGDLIKKEKNELKDFIDSYYITPSNYETMVNLYKNYDSRLFTRIIEGIYQGNLNYLDFKTIFNDSDLIEKSIISQEKIYRENKLMREHLIENGHTIADMSFSQFILNNTEAIGIERENIIYKFLTEKTDDPIAIIAKEKILNDIINDTTDGKNFLNSFILSAHDFIIPVDYDHIVLNENDMTFATENGLSEHEMKKMKSLVAYLKTF